MGKKQTGESSFIRFPVLAQHPKTAVVSFLRRFAEETGREFAVPRVISDAGTAFAVLIAGIRAGAIHGFVGFTRHFNSAPYLIFYAP